MGYCLVLLTGPARGASVRLAGRAAPVTIGRDAARDLPLDDPLCSRLHARLWPEGEDQWLVEDCGSRNGTYVNGQRIDNKWLLNAGDLIRVGEQLLVFADDRDRSEELELRPSRLARSTVVVRVAEPAKREAVLEQLRTQGPQRPLRDAAVLCRLANCLHRARTVRQMVQQLIDALAEGVQADQVAVYLVGTHGRLRRVGQLVQGQESEPAHVLASLAVANDEALLIGGEPTAAALTDKAAAAARSDQTAEPAPANGPATSVAPGEPGSSLAVPLPGPDRPRGAVECHRRPETGRFCRQDLELAMAVACQAGMALENIEHRERLEQANRRLRAEAAERVHMIARCRPMQELLEQVARIAPTASTVLIYGESGTGKELVARSIHDLSGRADGPYVAINCAAVSQSLLESELFGHEKGAFTGAERRRAGQFEQAHGGTIFLDEVGELSPDCQAKLLRVLEGHPFQRLGGTEPVQVDVRIVAATHRDLQELVGQGRFRQDLYYRLGVIELHVPPLRERGDEELLALAEHFLTHFRRRIGRGPSRLSPAAADAIVAYYWPGNVRELKNAIERAVVLGRTDQVQPQDLGLGPGQQQPPADFGPVPLKQAERLHIANVLRRVAGNKTKACKILEIGRGTLYKKLKQSS